MEINQATPAKPVLFALPFASSRFGLPEAYNQAHDLFAEAERDFAKGQPGKAAPKFLQVAQLVAAPKQATTYSPQFAQMRAACYRDAALAFQQADDAEAGKKALTSAMKSDAENADLLKKLIAEL